MKTYRRTLAAMRRALFALSVLVVGSCAVWAPGDSTSDARAPTNEAQAVILVAHPRITNATYRRSVLVVIPAGGGRHVGLIINRATPVKLANLYPDHPPSRNVAGPVFLGGPEARNSLVAIARAPADPGEGALALTEKLFLVTRAATIDQIIEKHPNEARFYVGQVRWRSGELRTELERKLWYVLPADAAVILSNDPANLWVDLMRRLRTLHPTTASRQRSPDGARPQITGEIGGSPSTARPYIS